jgi:hypothetical protein
VNVHGVSKKKGGGSKSRIHIWSNQCMSFLLNFKEMLIITLAIELNNKNVSQFHYNKIILLAN